MLDHARYLVGKALMNGVMRRLAAQGHHLPALLMDPARNVILMDGYNGGPRGGGTLCGGDVCLRDAHAIPSGTMLEIGCHHAEMNVICNAAASGVATKGAWLIVTGEPL